MKKKQIATAALYGLVIVGVLGVISWYWEFTNATTMVDLAKSVIALVFYIIGTAICAVWADEVRKS